MIRFTLRHLKRNCLSLFGAFVSTYENLMYVTDCVTGVKKILEKRNQSFKLKISWTVILYQIIQIN